MANDYYSMTGQRNLGNWSENYGNGYDPNDSRRRWLSENQYSWTGEDGQEYITTPGSDPGQHPYNDMFGPATTATDPWGNVGQLASQANQWGVTNAAQHSNMFDSMGPGILAMPFLAAAGGQMAFGGGFGGAGGAGASAGASGGGYPASWNMLAGEAPQGGMELGGGFGTSAGAAPGLDSGVAGGALGPQFNPGISAGTNAGIMGGDALAGTQAASGASSAMDLFTGGPAAMSSAEGGIGSFLQSLGINPGQLTAAGLNYFTQQRQANQLGGLSNQAFNTSAINQPQRAPYQQQLNSLISNPSDFFKTNPLFQAQADQARQAFQANSAKSGMGGTTIDAYMKNIMNAGAGTYFDQANLLSGLGGFNQGPGNAGAGVQAGIAGAAQGAAGTNPFVPIAANVANSSAANNAFSSLFNTGNQANPVSNTSTTFS